MPSYTLTVELPDIYGPYSAFYFLADTYQTNESIVGSGIDDIAQEVLNYYTSLAGSGTYTVEGDTITFTWTYGDTFTDIPVALTFEGGAGTNVSAGWQLEVQPDPLPTTLCNECQDLTLPDCTEPSLDLDLEDGTYTVSIEDHTSGNTYTQTISVSDGDVDWNGANTAGVFTPFSVFTVTIADDNGAPVTWTSGYNEYNCVRLTFAPTTDTTPID